MQCDIWFCIWDIFAFLTHSLTVSRADAQAKVSWGCMTDLALVILLRRAVLGAELLDVRVLASNAHMQ